MSLHALHRLDLLSTALVLLRWRERCTATMSKLNRTLALPLPCIHDLLITRCPFLTRGPTASSRDGGLVYQAVMIMSLAQGVAERSNFVWSPHTCPFDSKHNAAAMTQSIAHPSLSWTEKEVFSTTREKRRMLSSYPDRSSPSLSSYQIRLRRCLAPRDSHPCLAQAPCRLPLRLGLSRCMRSSRLSQAQPR